MVAGIFLLLSILYLIYNIYEISNSVKRLKLEKDSEDMAKELDIIEKKEEVNTPMGN